MLVLSRRAGEKIMVGDSIVITFLGIENGQGRIGIQAPRGVVVDREEISEKKKHERRTLD